MPELERGIGLIGNGGHAREIASYLGKGRVAFNAVHPAYLTGESGLIDIGTTAEELLACPVVAAVGSPGLKRELLAVWRGKTFATIVAPTATMLTQTALGDGVILAPSVVISVGVTLGPHVHVNVGATISHDCTVAEFGTISPGAHIGGGVHIGPGTFLGIGSIVRDHVSICEGALIGAGAVVVKDITTPGTYVGNPARWMSNRSGWQALS